MAIDTAPIVRFLEAVVGALGIETPIEIEALQHVVDMAFMRSRDEEQRVFVDALGYRKGKDVELRQMAKLLAAKAKETGLDQQIGPLNPYERRIVHLAVAEIPGASSESIGDAFSKTVFITAEK
jgi:spoIIIJ-associated protein